MAAPESAVDESVRALVAAGDPVGIEIAYDSWGREVFAIARRLLHQQAAEDVVAAGFLHVWRQSASELAKHGALRTYHCRWVADEAARRTTVKGPVTASR